MKYLTVDFGSTYTKLTAIDTERGDVIGTAAAFTTIETDVMEGFNNGMQQLEAQMGHFEYDRLLCCSSAAGSSQNGSIERRRKGGKNLLV